MGKLDLLKSVAPQQTVSTDALGNLLGRQQQSLLGAMGNISDLGETADVYGRQQNTKQLSDLIARGQLDELDADALRQHLAGVDTSRLTPEGFDRLNQLIGSKEAFAKTDGGVILKDATVKQLTEGETKPTVKPDSYYLNWKSKDPIVNKGLEGTTLNQKKLFVDEYEKGDVGSKPIYDAKGKLTGANFTYKGKTVTLLELQDKIDKQKAVLAAGSKTTPKQKAEAVKEIANVKKEVEKQSVVNQLVAEGAESRMGRSGLTRSPSAKDFLQTGKVPPQIRGGNNDTNMDDVIDFLGTGKQATP